MNAVLTNPDHRKIKNYTRKIFDHYIRDKRQQSKKEFKNLQFLFIHSIETLSNMPDITDTLSSELYSDPTVIQDNLLWHAQSLVRKSEDIQILGMKYLLETIESKD